MNYKDVNVLLSCDISYDKYLTHKKDYEFLKEGYISISFKEYFESSLFDIREDLIEILSYVGFNIVEGDFDFDDGYAGYVNSYYINADVILEAIKKPLLIEWLIV